MSVGLNPYISFKDNARQAMEFYKTVFGGELVISTFKDLHADVKPDEEELVMHAVLSGDNGIRFMASDTPSHIGYKPGANISMALGGEDEAILTEYYNKLAVGGTPYMPLTKADWGDTFGMLTDQFGIGWMVNIAAPTAAA